MKKFHKNLIKRQADVIRKAVRKIKSLREYYSQNDRKNNIKLTKLYNGSCYDPIRAQQLLLSCKDTKAALLFRSYIALHKPHHSCSEVIVQPSGLLNVMIIILLGGTTARYNLLWSDGFIESTSLDLFYTKYVFH